MAASAPDGAFTYSTLLLDAIADDGVDGTVGGDMGSFLRLHLDTAGLAAYESPSFDEATAVPLAALALSQSPARPAKRAKSKAPASAMTTDIGDADPDVSALLSALQTPVGSELRCRYRKGKCGNPRTLKKNGSLHSYCEFHRQRSVVNQRRFDTKKREARSACHACARETMAPRRLAATVEASQRGSLDDAPAQRDSRATDEPSAWV